MEYEERSLAVNGYQLAALEWNPGGTVKVIACHGWLDNAASFIRLAPRLRHCHVLALDLAGHGHSDHRPHPAGYNLWDDLTDILAVADQQGWQRFHLLGHSRGGMINLLLSTAAPERVRSLVLIDALLPKPVTHADTVGQLGLFLGDYFKPRTREHAGYASVEKAVQVRCKAIGMRAECARPIVERALVDIDDRYYWRSDPRLRNASAFKLTDAHNRAILDALSVPLLLLISQSGLGTWEYFNTLLQDYPRLAPEVYDGSHHFHLEALVEPVAGRINAFYGELAG